MPAEPVSPRLFAPTGSGWSEPFPGRSCGSCMLCCKLPSIVSLNKPPLKWCDRARPGSGCGDYTNRPHECRAFHCGWRTNPTLSDEWKPDRSKFFIAFKPNGNVLIMVDPGSPTAWRDSRFYPHIKLAAAHLLEREANIVVYVGRRAVLVLPDKDVDLGVIPDTFHVRIVRALVNGKKDLQILIEPDPSWAPREQAEGGDPTAKSL